MKIEEIIKRYKNLDKESKNIILEEFLEEVSENSLLVERICHKEKYTDEIIEKSKKNIIDNFRYFIKLSEDKNHKFSIRDIKDCNYNILKDIMVGGILRSDSIRLSGTDYIPPSPESAYYMLKDLEYYVNELDKLPNKNILEIAAYIHCEIIKIHPFEDGNGRTARAMMNYYLLRNNCMPIIIWYNVRDEYLKYNGMYFKTDDIKPYVKFLENLLFEQYEIINEMLKRL